MGEETLEEALKRLEEEFAAQCRVAAPLDFADRVMARIGFESEAPDWLENLERALTFWVERRWWEPVMLVGGAMAGVSLAAAVIWSVFSGAVA